MPTHGLRCRWAQLCVCIVLAGSVGCERSDKTPHKGAAADPDPYGIDHVVLVSIDTLRADHLACYGHGFIKSPNIDSLAGEGMLSTQHIAAVSTTLSSHTSMMTGMYPHTHGVVKNGYHVNDENVMLAEVLKEAGFVTAGFVGAVPLDPRVNFHQGFDHYDAEYTWGKPGVGGGLQRRASEVTDAVIAWLDQRSRDKSRSARAKERLFLFVHYFDVHWPYTPPPPFARMYRNDSRELDGSMEVVEDARELLSAGYRWYAAQGRGAGAPPPPPELVAKIERGNDLARILDREYCAEVTFCDHHLGRLMDALKERNLLDSSLIIVTSDHGETMHEHFNVFNHGKSVYDTEIHIPLILRFPKARYAGRRVARLISTIDLVPTILELLGISRDENIEGESFAGLLDGSLPPRAPVFAEATQPWHIPEFHDDPVWPNRLKFQGIRTDRYKYMFRVPDHRREFYDLQLDPTEQVNLLRGGKEYDAAVLAELQRELEAWWSDAHPIEFRGVDSKEHFEALRSLGYVGDEPDEDD